MSENGSDMPDFNSPIITPYLDNLEKAVNTRSKQEIASFFKMLYEGLASATEPFYRYNMGERYFNASSYVMGMAIWLLASLGSWVFGSVIHSSYEHFGEMLGQPPKLLIFARHPWIPLASGGLLLAALYLLFQKNASWILNIRDRGEAYHTRSPGKRYVTDGFTSLCFSTVIVGVLFICNPLAGIAFILSRGVAQSREAEQQAKLWDAFFNSIDAEVEARHLEDAILGKCPPEITFLYAPISFMIDQSVRENVAASNVGRPVRLAVKIPHGSRSNATPAAISPNEPETAAIKAAPDANRTSPPLSCAKAAVPQIEQAIVTETDKFVVDESAMKKRVYFRANNRPNVVPLETLLSDFVSKGIPVELNHPNNSILIRRDGEPEVMVLSDLVAHFQKRKQA